MKHALILGTLAGQTDAIRLLKEMGWKVSACGRRREGPGPNVADGFHLVDILDVDGVCALVEREGVDIVYSVGSDIAMPTVAAVSERLNLPLFHSLETTETLHRKVLLRTFLNRNDISPVQFCRARVEADLEAFSAYPAILKPTDSQGQRGITVVGSLDEARAALPRALAESKSGEAILEEFIDGPEVSVHVFVVDGRVAFYLPSDRITRDAPALGVATGHAIPATCLDDVTGPQVADVVQRFVAALGVRNGPLYFQMMLSPEKGPRIIEVAPRLDGCFMWRQIELHTGFNIMKACFERLAGQRWTPPAAWDEKVSHTLRFHFQKTGEPFAAAIHRPAEGDDVVYQEFHYREGDPVRATNGRMEKVGFYIVKARV